MQLNPTFNNQAYQRYSNSGFKNAGFDGFTLIQAKDVFEDYKISGGIKGPVQLNNIGLIVIYENLKKDWIVNFNFLGNLLRIFLVMTSLIKLL